MKCSVLFLVSVAVYGVSSADRALKRCEYKPGAVISGGYYLNITGLRLQSIRLYKHLRQLRFGFVDVN